LLLLRTGGSKRGRTAGELGLIESQQHRRIEAAYSRHGVKIAFSALKGA
jgi:membrane protein DedA with SNARE-associated domain